jgi:hypothetical protein
MTLENFEDKQIIGTELYEPFQRMCSLAGKFAIREAFEAGLPVTGVDKERNIVKTWPDGHKEIIGKAPPLLHLEKTEFDMTELSR